MRLTDAQLSAISEALAFRMAGDMSDNGDVAPRAAYEAAAKKIAAERYARQRKAEVKLAMRKAREREGLPPK